MMTLITNDSALRKYIPNVLATVDDELPLFDKLAPFLSMAESWLIENVTGTTVLDKIATDKDDKRFTIVAMVVVSHAFALAVPSLDLVLTPNGFGIVSNNNVAPASKERVERLINSLLKIKSQGLLALIPLLRSDQLWHNSNQCKWFAESIIQELEAVDKCYDDDHDNISTQRWDKFLSLREKAYPIEQEIANRWISPQLMTRLCRAQATDSFSNEEYALIRLINAVVLNAVKSGSMNLKLLEDAVSFIRALPSVFPEWHSSNTAQLFNPPIFENEKNSGGYFF